MKKGEMSKISDDSIHLFVYIINKVWNNAATHNVQQGIKIGTTAYHIKLKYDSEL